MEQELDGVRGMGGEIKQGVRAARYTKNKRKRKIFVVLPRTFLVIGLYS